MAATTATATAAPKFAAEQYYEELKATCTAITAPGKGILAADESTNTIGSRFKEINLENTVENRRAYRELLFTTPGKLDEYISGVILYEETLNQESKDGVKFAELLKSRGILTGIKVDKGTVVLDGTDNETATQGLDGLAERCRGYYQQGARFAKWRAVLRISAATGCPSEQAVQENAWGLARYASICQQCGLAPIVEPEVLMDGTHTIEQAAAATQRVQAAVVKALHDNNVLFEGMLLKPNMVLAGTDLVAQTGRRPSPDDVARWTLHVLTRTLPAAVPGVVFLSGGQSEEEATINLNAINRAPLRRPWALTFSYGRALQKSTIKAWAGKPENVAAAQKTFFERAKANSEATFGKYAGGAGGAAASESSFVKDYKY